MNSEKLHILLADDDIDDCNFFKRALDDLALSAQLTIVNDGEQLIKYLSGHLKNTPDVIFLDLSMPRKTGFECLLEIKENVKLKDIPVFVFSTSFSRDLIYEQNLIGTLSNIGAQEYIRKPGDFEQLKAVIHNSLVKMMEKRSLNERSPVNAPSIPIEKGVSK